MLIHLLVPPSFFMGKIFRMKSQIYQENSDYFIRLGNSALSHYGGCIRDWCKAVKNVLKKIMALEKCEITSLTLMGVSPPPLWLLRMR